MENKLKFFINPDIKEGDIVQLIDGSGLHHDKLDDKLFIVFSYPELFDSNEILKNLEFKVIKTNIKDRISTPVNHIYASFSFLLDIEIENNGVKLRTCSKFVTKIK